METDRAILPEGLGPYVVEAEIGRGGMGVVFLGRDTRLGRTVAIKMLPDELARDPERLARFQREAKVLASLHHPHIAAIHGLKESDRGARFLILERVAGRTLEERLGEGPLPLAEALDVCSQIALALGAAHGCGVIHRDLKPANVMLTPQGFVKVLDFGLAKDGGASAHPDLLEPPATASPGAPRPMSSAAASGATEAGAMLGTPGYMSPEQVTGRPQDRRSDVFAFGCVAYECLTGRAAFGGRMVDEIVYRVLAMEPDWSALPAATPPRFHELLRRCLHKDANERASDMDEIRAELLEILASSSGVGTPAGRTTVRRQEATPAGDASGARLPAPSTSFVGREDELEECRRLLGHTRLLTLVGSGGCGKTRLALRLGEILSGEYPDGAVFVDLARLPEGDRVLHAAAAALDVAERPDQPLARTLVERLADRRTLLILDNCEHVVAAARELAVLLLDSCPRVEVVATSREWLGAAGEQTYSVPPLPVPEPGGDARPESIARHDAVRLFVERAAWADPSFALSDRNAESVAEICRRLDGIPLAIELAAARVSALGVDEVRSRLDDRFRLLTGDPGSAVPRQRTLWAAIEWSFEQLLDDERHVLVELSVFQGGWSLEAAAAVTGPALDEFEALDVLTRLVDRSLVAVVRSRGLEPRYRLLETVREYAAEKRAGFDEGDRAADRHLDYFLGVAETSEPKLWGREQAAWLDRLEIDHENLLAAAAWSERAEGGARKGLRLAGALYRFWYTRGHYTLGRDRLRRALAHDGANERTPARAKALVGAAGLAFFQGDFDAARALHEEALEIYRALDDSLGVGRTLIGLGLVATNQGDYESARSHYESCLELYRATNQRSPLAVVLNNLGNLASWQGRVVEARARFEESAAHARAAGNQAVLALALSSQALMSVRLADPAAARALVLESLGLVQELGARNSGLEALETVAELAASWSAPGSAARLYAAARSIRETVGFKTEPPEVAAQARVQKRLRSELGEDRFDAAWAEGSAMSFESALSEARRWVEECRP